MVFKDTFNNISVKSWPSVLLVEETGVPRENHRHVKVTDKVYYILYRVHLAIPTTIRPRRSLPDIWTYILFRYILNHQQNKTIYQICGANPPYSIHEEDYQHFDLHAISTIFQWTQFRRNENLN